MSSYKKEEASKAVGDTLDALFGSGMSGARSVDVVWNDDGTRIVVSNPVSYEDGEAFVNAWNEYEENETVEMLDEAAARAIPKCKYCERQPCIVDQEYD